MMIAVIADTHRRTPHMMKVAEVLKVRKPDHILHLGDNEDDAEFFSELLNQEVISVPGNTDYSHGLQERIFEAGGHRIFMAHGHKHHVRQGLDKLAIDAKNHGCDIALYGHTHIAHEEHVLGVYIFNPGSASEPRNHQKPSFGLITLDAHGISFELVHI
ncbi:MAG TPA: metallophosphoesterase [Clostridiaceae bacterium]|nr:metallophosphoesterase [Clostridiaceae bacterium]